MWQAVFGAPDEYVDTPTRSYTNIPTLDLVIEANHLSPETKRPYRLCQTQFPSDVLFVSLSQAMLCETLFLHNVPSDALFDSPFLLCHPLNLNPLNPKPLGLRGLGFRVLGLGFSSFLQRLGV